MPESGLILDIHAGNIGHDPAEMSLASMLHHDMTSLRLFVAICEMRSLTRAAESVNLALSAASRRLRLIEEEVGAPLVRRLPHGFEPTIAGFTMLRYAQTVLHLGDQLTANIADHRAGVRGRVRVFASSSALVQRLAADLAAFAHEHPDIRRSGPLPTLWRHSTGRSPISVSSCAARRSRH